MEHRKARRAALLRVLDQAPLRALLDRSGWAEVEIIQASGRLEPWLQVTCRRGARAD